MVLKRKFNLQSRIFIPLVTILWIVIIALGIVMYRHDVATRKEMYISQLDAFNNVLLRTYNDKQQVADYLDFIDEYFKDTPLDDVLIGVYDGTTGKYLDGKGFEFMPPSLVDQDHDGVINGNDLEAIVIDSVGYKPDDAFLYKSTYSHDSTLIVRTIMPSNVSISRAVSTDMFLWVIIFGVLVCITVISYLMTRHITRNVRLLRDFVERAANDRDFVTYDKFPDDELGDISRKVIHIYNARSAAVAAREHEHNMALHAIEERAKLKRQLTNNISHELKTPVGIVKGYLDTVIEEKDMDDNARRHFLIKAQSQVNRLCDLLADLSTMTRLEESSSQVNIEPLNFSDLVASTIEDVEASGIAGDMRLTMAVPLDCVVMGNKALLSGMLHNLIKNAIFYSHGTEMVVKCTDVSDHYYSFVFYDDGVGVPPESLSHLFERFYRVDTGRSRRNGGTGLGLPIVKSTIIAMGGTITVSNRPAGGLQFTFTLPRPKDNK